MPLCPCAREAEGGFQKWLPEPLLLVELAVGGPCLAVAKRLVDCWERTAGMHWKGGRYPSLCPATVPLKPSASFNGICNRQ